MKLKIALALALLGVCLAAQAAHDVELNAQSEEVVAEEMLSEPGQTMRKMLRVSKRTTDEEQQQEEEEEEEQPRVVLLKPKQSAKQSRQQQRARGEKQVSAAAARKRAASKAQAKKKPAPIRRGKVRKVVQDEQNDEESSEDDEDDEVDETASDDNTNDEDEDEDEPTGHTKEVVQDEEEDGAEERELLKRKAQLLLAKEKGRVKSEEKKQSDRVRLAEQMAEQAHEGHDKVAKKAKSKVNEAKAAFEHAEDLIKQAENAGLRSQRVHEAAEKAEKFHDKKHQDMAKKLHNQEKELANEQKKDVLMAQKELERAQVAHEAAMLADKQAQLFENRELVAEQARSKAHGDLQRSHLEEIALNRMRSEDLLKQAPVHDLARQAIEHQKSREEMYGVPIPAGAPMADARGVRDDVEEYLIPDNAQNQRGHFIDCPVYQNMQCGGPSRGKCDRQTGTCQCNEGVGATGGYFGVACECGWAKSKCNPPECHWCNQMNICVKDRSECMRKPHGREGPLGQADVQEELDFLGKRGKSESVENEHHNIIAPHNGLHDHSLSHHRPLDKLNEDIGEAPTVDSSDSSTGIIVALCLLLFTIVLVIGAYLGFSPKGKSREDNPMTHLDSSVTGSDKSGARRRQATRDE